MIRIGLLSNPNSQRNQRGLDDLHAVVGRVPNLLHAEAASRSDLLAILGDFARREVGLLVVNGGDGTVQRMLTALFEARPFERPPPIALLPRGMANMTAADVGLRRPIDRGLHRLVRSAQAGKIDDHIQTRQILRVENLPGIPPQRCMFFGAAAIYDAIELCHERVYPLGLKGNLGMSLTLVGTLLAGLLHGPNNGILRSHEIGVQIDNGPIEQSRLLLVLATTLDRLILRSQPFWNQTTGAIRYTSIAYPPAHLLRSAPKVLYGWRRASLDPDSYASRGAHRLTLTLESPFTLDGELFHPSPDQPLVLTAADSVRFVRI